jgi:hypothetical protein
MNTKMFLDSLTFSKIFWRNGRKRRAERGSFQSKTINPLTS